MLNKAPITRSTAPIRELFLILVLFSPFSTHFAMAASGTEAASFLDIPVGGAPAALGSAYSALASDAYAPVWNPGGLGFVDSTQFAAQHVSYLESIHYEYLGGVVPLKIPGAIGASIQYLGTGDITKTDINGSTIGNFSSHYAAYSLAYGRKVTDNLAFGLNGKIIDAQINSIKANAYAFDMGTMAHVNRNLTLAAVVTNAGSKLTFLSEGGSLPLAGHVGAAYQVTPQWNFTAEGVYAQTGLASGHWGVEWRPLSLIALRAGYKTDTVKELGATAGVTAGAGLMLWGQEFDYAWVPLGDLGNVQYFSVLIRLGKEAAKEHNLIRLHTIKQHHLVRADNGESIRLEENAHSRSWYEDNIPDVLELLQDEEHPVAKVAENGQ